MTIAKYRLSKPCATPDVSQGVQRRMSADLPERELCVRPDSRLVLLLGFCSSFFRSPWMQPRGSRFACLPSTCFSWLRPAEQSRLTCYSEHHATFAIPPTAAFRPDAVRPELTADRPWNSLPAVRRFVWARDNSRCKFSRLTVFWFFPVVLLTY